MEREHDILKHFYEGSSKSTSTCIHCGHVVKHKSASDVPPLYGLVLHMLSVHGDIFDRNQYMMDKRVSLEKVEQLPVVEPKFDNFEEAREHSKALSEQNFAMKEKAKEKKEKEKNYAWQYFIRHRSDNESRLETAVCKLCNKSYQAKGGAKVVNLKKHLDQEHQICDPEMGPGAFVCSTCGQGFNLKSDLWRHELR